MDLELKRPNEKIENAREISEIEDEIKDKISKELGIGALSALKAGKAKITSVVTYDFIEYLPEKDSIREIVHEILDGNRSVIISFGRFGDDSKANIIIANLVSKRLWRAIIDRIMNRIELKYKILIMIEEAHKFLSPVLYYKTPFGNITRELKPILTRSSSFLKRFTRSATSLYPS